MARPARPLGRAQMRGSSSRDADRDTEKTARGRRVARGRQARGQPRKLLCNSSIISPFRLTNGTLPISNAEKMGEAPGCFLNYRSDVTPDWDAV